MLVRGPSRAAGRPPEDPRGPQVGHKMTHKAGPQHGSSSLGQGPLPAGPWCTTGAPEGLSIEYGREARVQTPQKRH
eukprot:4167958-Pyramimonas_sp.AAC.1